jgi:hypothetical protein
MSRAGSQVHRASAITELGALNTQELAAEERLAGLWGRPVGSPCNALERAIGARFNSDGTTTSVVRVSFVRSCRVVSCRVLWR